MLARAIYRAAKIAEHQPPYDVVTMKIYYPGKLTGSDSERNEGIVIADSNGAPYPVLVMMPGINVAVESYGWLGAALAEQGIITVTYSLIIEEIEGIVSLSPGVKIQQLSPDHFGKQPSSSTLPTILKELEHLNAEGILKGLLDLNKIILGGHSAGGTMSLLNANPEWFPQIKAAFAFGAHTAGSTIMGWPENTIMPISSELPILLIGGNEDGVIAASAHRYGDDHSDPCAAIKQTFEKGITSNRLDCYLVIVDGANHFALSYPKDQTTGRPFLEKEQSNSEEIVHAYMQQLITLFIKVHVIHDLSSTQQLEDWIDAKQTLVASSARK